MDVSRPSNTMAEYAPSNSPSMSEDIRLLAQALLKAKEHFRPTGLSATNTHQKYSYAKLGDIYRAVETALALQGILIWHYAIYIDGKEFVLTRLIHSLSGQYVQDMRLLESEKPGNQGKSAALTYIKKQAVLGLCGIAAEEDDDCQEEETYIEKKKSYVVNDKVITPDQLTHLQGLLKSASNGKELYADILQAHKIKDLSQLKQSSFEHECEIIVQYGKK